LVNAGQLDDAALCSLDFEYVDNQNLQQPLDAAGLLTRMRQELGAAPDRRVTIDARFDDDHGSGILVMTWCGTFDSAEQPTVTGMVSGFDTREGRVTRQRVYYEWAGRSEPA
jgi:hypothetical protein